jgi:lipoprotein-anchoring transpeptidase ErfK/SrfK
LVPSASLRPSPTASSRTCCAAARPGRACTTSSASTAPTSAARKHAPGTIVINTAERRLYLVQANGSALRYGIGVGRIGFQWKGTHKVTAKKEKPDWTAPAEMRARQKDVPARMKGGDPDNPLGTHALYLGSTLYRIHGSPDPDSVGEAESSGCFRMRNPDVADLYKRVPVGTTVIVQ